MIYERCDKTQFILWTNETIYIYSLPTICTIPTRLSLWYVRDTHPCTSITMVYLTHIHKHRFITLTGIGHSSDSAMSNTHTMYLLYLHSLIHWKTTHRDDSQLRTTVHTYTYYFTPKDIQAQLSVARFSRSNSNRLLKHV